ncbi:DUF3180 domain-containing protein [Leucobacter sp. UCMA 4100]|uniref:DUF3180 domain-containing protein n=1 Tax=Leucobacter sp. UCMA 4100 TaxID=2810534 RepID=UPI0022EB7C9F|nr:DUF3180 domain-containing protein [Leucobacter sp. UCMA 4100]MDA3146297.1 DUF3180 domain-containing protein [Leucobacter sp. UCMA 4100]
MNPGARKLNPLTLVVFGIVGAGIGLLLQTYRSGVGVAPFAPPLSLPASLLVIAVLLIVLALRLKRAIVDTRTITVNPFHAVRLLAAAWASQFTGALFAGFGLGLFVMIAGRVTQLAAAVWLPMGLTTLTALVLLIAGLFAERVCRIPPDDGAEKSASDERAEGPEHGTAQAYERPKD